MFGDKELDRLVGDERSGSKRCARQADEIVNPYIQNVGEVTSSWISTFQTERMKASNGGGSGGYKLEFRLSASRIL